MSQIPINAKPLAVQDVAAVNRVEPNNSSVNAGNEAPNGALPYANSLMSGSKVGAWLNINLHLIIDDIHESLPIFFCTT